MHKRSVKEKKTNRSVSEEERDYYLEEDTLLLVIWFLEILLLVPRKM
jgi:hypothetical protein